MTAPEMGHEQGHAGSHDDAHGAAHDHAHDFDPEPTQTLAEGEPRTPSWVPVLGLGLFLVAGIWFLVANTGDAPKPTAQAEVAAPPTPAAPAREAAPRPAAPRLPADRPAADGGAKPRPQLPQDPKARRELIEQLRKDRGTAAPRPTAKP